MCPRVVDKNNKTIYKVDAGIGWSWFRLGQPGVQTSMEAIHCGQ